MDEPSPSNVTLPDLEDKPMQKELYSSWALLILMTLLFGALWTSYYLQLKKIRVVHETVVSIFAGMFVGLLLKITPGDVIRKMVSFNPSYFFNLLLPPIILNSGYELKREDFFRNITNILTFAFAGTFITAIAIGTLTYVYSLIGLEGISLGYLDSLIFGSILSATDPVTILAIFQQLRVEPKLYAVIFGESILNDAVAIVLVETLQSFRGKELHIQNVMNGVGHFFGIFLGSLGIGVVFGLAAALMLKHSTLRRFPSIEACLVSLIAYSSYLFATAIEMSGIVALLFCGMILKHYAYDNMSRRTRHTTKSMFRVLSQLSENFIFIYLGLNLFTLETLVYKPVFILFTTVAVCASRYSAVFPLAYLLNVRNKYWPTIPKMPREHQIMLFWAGLRGAIAFALSGDLDGESAAPLRTTILVTVVLTMILFGSTISTMLQVLSIRTGVLEAEPSSSEDDEGESPYTTRTVNIPHGPYEYNHLGDGDHHGESADDEEDGQNGNLFDGKPMDLANELVAGLLGRNGDTESHWFMSFDDKWLKPFFTSHRAIRRHRRSRQSSRINNGQAAQQLSEFVGLANIHVDNHPRRRDGGTRQLSDSTVGDGEYASAALRPAASRQEENVHARSPSWFVFALSIVGVKDGAISRYAEFGRLDATFFAVLENNGYQAALDVHDMNSINQAFIEVSKIAPEGIDALGQQVGRDAGIAMAWGLDVDMDERPECGSHPYASLEKRQRRLLVTISSDVASDAIMGKAKQTFIEASYLVSKAAVNMLNTTDSTSTVAAEVSVEESIEGMLKVMDNFTLKDSGKCMNYKGAGDVLPY